MPSQILHYLFGEDFFSEIRRRVTPMQDFSAGNVMGMIPDAHKSVFALGCQGPDIFYHSRGRRPVGLEYGSLLHRRGMGAFMAGLLEMGIAKRRPGEGMNALGAYALGFLTHAILDRYIHPYIVYKTAWLLPSNPAALRLDHSHVFFERIIDVLMLKTLRGMDISAWDQEGFLSEICENPPSGLKELLARALIHAFPERAGKDDKLLPRIENTFHDCAFFYRLTAPSKTRNADHRFFPLKMRHLVFLFPEELPGHIDFLNLEKRPWFYPVGDEKEDLRSFPELYAETVIKAADLFTGIIGMYLTDGRFPFEDAARVIGDTGLSIVDEAGKPCAPNRSAPLPLDEVLVQQAALRGLGGCEFA